MSLFGTKTAPAETYPVERTEEEWARELTPEQYDVMRRHATERPWSGEHNETKDAGVFRCAGCGAELFRSETKFDGHCGWPSFYAPTERDNVELIEDRTMGMRRVEVRCASCGSHLGHVFHGEGYATPTDDRYCINSISLTLEPKA